MKCLSKLYIGYDAKRSLKGPAFSTACYCCATYRHSCSLLTFIM